MPSYTKEEKAEIWLDSFGLDCAKKWSVRALADSAYALVARFARERGRIAKIVGEEVCAALTLAFGCMYVVLFAAELIALAWFERKL